METITNFEAPDRYPDANKLKKYDVHALARLACGAAEEHADLVGGYPDVVCVVADHIVIAGEDEANGPTLEVISPKQCRKWFSEILRSMKEYPDEEMCDHINETHPTDTIFQHA